MTADDSDAPPDRSVTATGRGAGVAGPPAGSVQSGIVVVDKPVGMTSHQVVGRIRRLAGTRKVGHAGTLDPMATGVLLIGVGRATRLLGHLALNAKEYSATIRLGVDTRSDDADGEVTARTGAHDLDDAAIVAAVDDLTGAIEQVPSSVSAIKVDGKRAYAKVRAGEQVELAARPVTVSRFVVLDRRDGAAEQTPVIDLDVEVACTSGTYVRALARDLGAALGTGGHLIRLRRTGVGGFPIDRAHTLEQLEDDLELVGVDEVARQMFGTRVLDEQQTAWVRNGRRLTGLALPEGLTALFGPDGTFLALYRPSGTDAVAEAVFV